MFKKYFIILVIVFVPNWLTGEENIPNGVQVHQADSGFAHLPRNRKSQPPPTAPEILEWLNPETPTKIEKIVRINLTGNEEAYLAAAYFPEAGRNFMFGSLLVRPKLKEAKQIDGVGYKLEVFDYDIRGASAIWTELVGSGQGTTQRCRRALYFDGWTPVILHEMWSGDNLGSCGEYGSESCYSGIVRWTFADLNGDGKADLVELVIERKGPNRDKLGWSTKLNVYLMKDDTFVLASSSARVDPGFVDKSQRETRE